MSSRSHLSRVGRAVAVVLTALVFFALVNTRGVEWASAAGVVNDSRLRPGTVQQADLPAGWADNTDMAGSAAADLPTICGLALPAPRALAFSRFNDEEVGSVSSLVVLLRHGAAKSWLERLARIIKRGCTQSLETGLEGEDPIKVRVFAFAVPVMGDQRVGMRFSSDLPSLKRNRHHPQGRPDRHRLVGTVRRGRAACLARRTADRQPAFVNPAPLITRRKRSIPTPRELIYAVLATVLAIVATAVPHARRPSADGSW